MIVGDLIGEGATRQVFELHDDPTVVIKFTRQEAAPDNLGWYNERELQFWETASPKTRELLAACCGTVTTHHPISGMLRTGLLMEYVDGEYINDARILNDLEEETGLCDLHFDNVRMTADGPKIIDYGE